MIIELSDFFNNPSIIDFGFINIQYYALTWVVSALLIYQYLKRHPLLINMGLNVEKVNDMVFLYGLLFGALVGGRVGYMLFYGTEQLISNPLSLVYIWQGGLSFHGGLLGVIIAMLVFANKNNLRFPQLMDPIALSMPIGLGIVRIGNFLNGELYGRPTEAGWGFIFPRDFDSLPRHPSQLYEFALEGVALFVILHMVHNLKPRHGVTASSLLIGYGVMRFIVEFFREPDAHLGFITLQLTMGQLLCIPMILVGIILVTYFSRRNATIS